MSAKRILVVDDEPDFARFMEDILKREGFVVSVVGNGLQALKMVAESRPDAILLDWNLPGKDGIE
ncbi:MAG: response regulator, partial [Elusimicrobia bacterium]|nr:response regulator [Elusimicrobiota bacterium]